VAALFLGLLCAKLALFPQLIQLLLHSIPISLFNSEPIASVIMMSTATGPIWRCYRQSSKLRVSHWKRIQSMVVRFIFVLIYFC
jgi:hypothetical protein